MLLVGIQVILVRDAVHSHDVVSELVATRPGVGDAGDFLLVHVEAVGLEGRGRVELLVARRALEVLVLLLGMAALRIRLITIGAFGCACWRERGRKEQPGRLK